MDNIIEYTFQAIVFFDESDSQYKPSVKVLRNGEFYEWRVFDLGFDEERFAMPYARQLMRDMVSIHRLSIDDWKENFGMKPRQ